MRASTSAEPALGARFVAVLAALLLASTVAVSGCGLGSSPPPAAVTVTDFELVDGQDSSRLQARLDHRMSDAMLDALHNGVPLTFVWELELIGRREWLWDAHVWSTGGSRQVSYRSLSRRYTVTTSGVDIATSYPDVERVLNALSQLDVVVPLTRGRLDALAQPYFRFRTRLDTAALPPPLRLPSYISADWRMDSGWHLSPRG